VKYRAVLDASAVSASSAISPRTSPTWIEPLAYAALIQAHVEKAEPAMQDLLVGLGHVVPVPLDLDDWKRTAAATSLLAGLDRACAALLVAYGSAQFLMTRQPDAYGEGIPTIGV
jgi:hypothetical protein